VSATTVELLRAAADIVGGNRALAIRLGVKGASRVLADSLALPEHLLLRAVDIILADRQSKKQDPGSPGRVSFGALSDG